jgi:colanic acid biosynthesis protein WcaH
VHIPDSIYQVILESLPILCVDLLILQDDKVLLLKRANHPALGQFWFPGGRVHKLERIKDAATRIALEETGLVCEFQEIVSVEETIFLKNDDMPYDKHTVNVCCKLRQVSPPDLVRIDKYHDGFEWVTHIRSDLHVAVRNPLLLIGLELTNT